MQHLRTRAVRMAVMVALVVAMALTASAAYAQPDMPVYRFYNQGTGTHFYTSSYEEMQNVLAKWPTVFTYEGIAFYTMNQEVITPEAIYGLVPLYRFYNVKNKSHFYTISAEERDAVKAKWSSIYTYEGEAFNVFAPEAADEAPVMPVYRFYNKLNGSHFYTISEFEKALVQSAWSNVYTYEGIAFYAFTWMGFS